MAKALTIGALSFHVLRQPTADGWTERTEAEGGALARALGGRQGGVVRWQKGEATARLAPLTDAELAALHAELEPPGSLSLCSGPALGGPVVCHVTIVDERARRRSGRRVWWWVTLRLRKG